MKVGDKVIVIDCQHGHEFRLGEELELLEYDETDQGWDCGNGGDKTWWLWEEEFKIKE